MPSTLQSGSLAQDPSAVLPFAVSSEAGLFESSIDDREDLRLRGRERYKRVAVTGVTSLAAKSVTLISTIVTVPLTYRYLGSERYGVWMTITSAVLCMGFADLGIGNGLTMRIAEAHGRDDAMAPARQVSCAFFFLLAICALVIMGALAAAPFVHWAEIYHAQSALARSESKSVSLILIVCTALSMPVGTVLRVQLGYQQGYLADLWNATGSALALAGIVFVTRSDGGLPALVLAVAGLPLLVTTINWSVEFGWRRPGLRPRLKLFDRQAAVQLAAAGSLFFVQQCFGLIYYVSDNLVIAKSMGAAAVAHYALFQRIFSIGLVTQYVIAPLWPAINEAISRRDLGWARKTTRRAMGLSVLLSGVLGALLLALSRPLMKRWTGVDPGPADMLRAGFALWVVAVGYIATMNALLNRPSLMLRHVALFGTASLASLALKIFFARQGNLAGVVWGTVVAFGVIYAVPAALLALRSFALPKERAA